MKRVTAMAQKPHIVLIGMPGSGKTTVGRYLALRIGYRFLDTDDLIEAGEGRSLARIIREDGLDGFRRIEAAYVQKTPLEQEPLVIATGGSVVYDETAMNYLKFSGTVVFLDLKLDELEARLGDLTDRGVVIEKGKTLEGLWDERCPLYLKYADVVVSCGVWESERTAAAVAALMKKRGIVSGSGERR